MRFFIAGVVLYGWLRLKGTPSPSRRHWLAASLLAVCIFVVDYGLLFWAEQRVPSGVAAVMLATIPVFMALSEIIFCVRSGSPSGWRWLFLSASAE